MIVDADINVLIFFSNLQIAVIKCTASVLFMTIA